MNYQTLCGILLYHQYLPSLNSSCPSLVQRNRPCAQYRRLGSQHSRVYNLEEQAVPMSDHSWLDQIPGSDAVHPSRILSTDPVPCPWTSYPLGKPAVALLIVSTVIWKTGLSPFRGDGTAPSYKSGRSNSRSSRVPPGTDRCKGPIADGPGDHTRQPCVQVRPGRENMFVVATQAKPCAVDDTVQQWYVLIALFLTVAQKLPYT